MAVSSHWGEHSGQLCARMGHRVPRHSITPAVLSGFSKADFTQSTLSTLLQAFPMKQQLGHASQDYGAESPSWFSTIVLGTANFASDQLLWQSSPSLSFSLPPLFRGMSRLARPALHRLAVAIAHGTTGIWRWDCSPMCCCFA